MEKVILTNEQAVALENLKGRGTEFAIAISIHNEGFSEKYDSYALNELSVEKLANAWINGYEIEETREEKILKEFNRIKEIINEMYKIGKNKEELEYYEGFISGIVYSLELLGKKIKGIND